MIIIAFEDVSLTDIFQNKKRVVYHAASIFITAAFLRFLQGTIYDFLLRSDLK